MSDASTHARPLAPAILVPGVLAAVLASVPAPGPAQEGAVRIPALPVDTFRLDNGLRVIVSEDHSAPVVAVELWFHVGSAHEAEGTRGFGHLFEHLLRDAGGAGAGGRLVTRAGGRSGADTGPDRTAFYEVLPSKRVNLALWLQARRLGPLRIGEAELEALRRVVREERRLALDATPYGRAGLALDTLSRDYAPYRNAPLASPDDLEAARPEDLRAFHGRWHVPSNAVLTVVGDVDAGRIREMSDSLLGTIRGGAPGPELPPAPLPSRTGAERRVTLDEPAARLPLVLMAWAVPPADHPDRHALELLTSILADGATSRLRTRLVDGEGAVAELTALTEHRVGPGTVRIGAVAGRGVDPGHVESLLLEEVGRLRREGVSARELQGALNRRRSELVGRLLTVRGRGSALQWHALHEGSPHALNRETARYEAVTAADIRRVARTWLVPGNRTVVVARPVSAGNGGGP